MYSHYLVFISTLELVKHFYLIFFMKLQLKYKSAWECVCLSIQGEEAIPNRVYCLMGVCVVLVLDMPLIGQDKTVISDM